MKRNDENFEVLQRVSDLFGRACVARLLHKTYRGTKALSPENRLKLAGLAWGGQILSVGIGLKMTGKGDNVSMEPDKLCLRFSVRRKIPMRSLDKLHKIPKNIRIDHLGLNIPTDVVDHAGNGVAQGIGPGLLGAQNAGPIGAVTAILRRPGKPLPKYALGCAHVLAPPGLDVEGRPVEAPPDGMANVLSNVVGTLFGWTALTANGTNYVDAALVKLNGNAEVTNQFPDGSKFGPIATTKDILDLPIRMLRGSTQRWTTGTIVAVNVTQSIANPGIGSYLFSGLVESQLFNAGGDSGSPVVAQQQNAFVSMHIGGDNMNTAWSVRIAPVLQHLKMTLD